MVTVLIFAGGKGQRMNTRTVPKQFLELHGKPIIIHTLEQFENHPEVDEIYISCIEQYIPYLAKLLDKFAIRKVRSIVPGGSNGQESIYNSLAKIQESCPADSIVLVHDGVRPLIDPETISANIASVKQHGSAITTAPAQETIVFQDEPSNEILQIYERKFCCVAKAPQSFFLKDLWHAHQQAIADGRSDFIDSASLMLHYGHRLYTVTGPTSNIKITTPADFYMFRALVDAKEAEQIMGL